MFTVFTPVTTKLISAKAASDLVPYSRDYIARIAREGKIHATQIDRQWFVEETSLLNFHEQAILEEEVRKRHLSQKRKLDLKVNVQYQIQLKNLEVKRAAAPVAAAVVATLVLLGGMTSGLVFLASDASAYLASLMHSDRQALTIAQTNKPLQTAQASNYVEPVAVQESTRALSLAGGIVLLPPTSTDSSIEAVHDLFSDTTTVTLTSSSTGVIEMEQNGLVTAMPFVRIPDQGTADMAVRARGTTGPR